MTTRQEQISTGAADEDDGSASHCNWTEVPRELLMMIFNELEFNLMESVSPIHDLLNCRLVHSSWKCVIDSVLEKRCLEHWTKWDPKFYPLHLYCFPFLRLQNSTGEAYRDYSELQRLQNKKSGSCPFPTRALCIDSDRRGYHGPNRPDIKWHILSNSVSFFSSWGHHLTSLTLRNLFLEMPAETFCGILSHTQNLKALELNRVRIKVLKNDLTVLSLPPLSQLAHVNLFKIDCDANITKYDAKKWILERYKKQILSLRTDTGLDGRLTWNEHKDAESFDNLQQLNIISPYKSLFCTEIQFPTLKCLSLKDLSVHAWEHVPKFLSKISSSLVRLHLDTKIWERCVRLSSQQVELINSDSTTFLKLKYFATNYPVSQLEVEMVKAMLQKFPDLEKLKFSDEDRNRLLVPGLNSKELKEHLGRERYWNVCQKLKSIEVETSELNFSITSLCYYRAPFLEFLECMKN